MQLEAAGELQPEPSNRSHAAVKTMHCRKGTEVERLLEGTTVTPGQVKVAVETAVRRDSISKVLHRLPQKPVEV